MSHERKQGDRPARKTITGQRPEGLNRRVTQRLREGREQIIRKLASSLRSRRPVTPRINRALTAKVTEIARKTEGDSGVTFAELLSVLCS
jgi:hypothetical protein